MSAARRMLERRSKPLQETSWEDNSSIRYFVLIQRILSDEALFASNSESVTGPGIYTSTLLGGYWKLAGGRGERGSKARKV